MAYQSRLSEEQLPGNRCDETATMMSLLKILIGSCKPKVSHFMSRLFQNNYSFSWEQSHQIHS